MFGLKKLIMDVEILSSQVNSIFMMIEELRQTNKEAIINRETITKFINDLNAIVKLSSPIDLKRCKEIKEVEPPKKRPGRPKRSS